MQASADAAESKAGFDKAVFDASAQKATFDAQMDKVRRCLSSVSWCALLFINLDIMLGKVTVLYFDRDCVTIFSRSIFSRA